MVKVKGMSMTYGQGHEHRGEGIATVEEMGERTCALWERRSAGAREERGRRMSAGA